MTLDLTPVPGYACTSSDDVLAAFCLGIINEFKLLTCISCPPHVLLLSSKAAAHAHAHMGANPSHTQKEINDILKSYPHFQDTFNKIDPPAYPTPPLKYLTGPHNAFLCVPCAEHPTHPETFIWRSDRRRCTHWKNKHPNHTFSGADEERILVQTFSDSDTHRRDFRVSEALLAASQHAARGQGDDTSLEASCALLKEWSPSKRQMPGPGATLKEVEPFGIVSGWSDFLSDQDWKKDRALVQKPVETALVRVYDTVKPLFIKLMKQLRRLAPSLRKLVTDEENRGGSDIMIPLQSEEQWELHGHTWALLLIYAMHKYAASQDVEQGQTHGTRQPQHITFTKNQQDWLKALWQYAKKESGHKPAQEVILGASAALWGPEVIDHLMEDTFDDAIIRFVVFSNLYDDGSFYSCAVISSFCARMKYIMRLSTLIWTRKEQKAKNKPISWIFAHIKNTLQAATVTPFGNIYHVMGAAVTYRQNYSGLPRVVWPEGPKTHLIVDGQTWHLAKLRDATGELIAEIDDGLAGLLDGATPEELGLHLSPDMKILDKHSNRTPGYSFLNDPENGFEKLEQNLGAHILGQTSGNRFHRGLDANGKISWRHDEIRTYLDAHQRVTRKMALSWHTTGGQGSRGAEFATIQLTEDVASGRGVMWINGRLCFLIPYNKTSAMTRSYKPTGHAIPWHLAKQFLIMNILVRPFVGQLVRILYGSDAQLIQEHKAFATHGKENTAAILGDSIETFFETKLGCKGVRLNALRHGVAEIQRIKIPMAADVFTRLEATVDNQAGHNSGTAAWHYGFESSERSIFLSTTMGKYILVSMMWWPIIVPQNYLTDMELRKVYSAPEQLSNDTGTSSSVNCDEVAEKTEDRIRRNILPDLEQMFLQANTSIVAMVQRMFDRVYAGTSIAAEQPNPTIPPKALVLLQRSKKDKHATWRSPGQAKALSIILENQSSLLCVLPTSGGKSLLFTSPVLIENGITLLLVPLLALKRNQISHLDTEGITYHYWSKNKFPTHGLVIASVESLIEPEDMLQWCYKAKADRLLNRIAMDEVHLALTAAHYRPAMMNVQRLVEVGVPIVALSATVPPLHEHRLRQAFGNPNWLVLREPTARPNIGYHMAHYLASDIALVALKRHVSHFRKLLKPHKQAMVIHCRTVADVKLVAKELNISGYWAPKEGEPDNFQVVEQWLDGLLDVIVTTAVIGAGVHNPLCQMVFHYGVPWSLIDYIQETSRAGRSGQPALAIMFHWGIDFQPNPVDIGGLKQLGQMIESRTCYRTNISAFVDVQHAKVTCSLGMKPCGNCRAALRAANERQGSALNGPDQWPALVQNHSAYEMLIESVVEPEVEDAIMESPDAQFNIDDYMLPAQTYRPVTPAHAGHGDSSEDTDPSDEAMISPPENPLHLGHARKPTLGQMTSPTAHLSRVAGRQAGLPTGHQTGFMSALAGPSTVAIDAERARGLRSEQVQASTHRAQIALTFSVPRVLAFRDYLSGCCCFCLAMNKKIEKGHRYTACPARGVKQTSYDLSEVTYKGQKFKEIYNSEVKGHMTGGHK
ncbi:hypothetical protein FRC09_001885, partial [Ceratobasidium sp. 395]